MKRFMMDVIIILLGISVISPTDAVMPLSHLVLPQGIESVNGSDVNMGCASSLVDSGSVVLCGNESYLSDGNSPAIDTSTSNWASHLVTVRKNGANDDITFDHVVLTFGFDAAISPGKIELDLFLCPEWNIGAPSITVFADESTSGLVYRLFSQHTNSDFLKIYNPAEHSCECLSTVRIPLQLGEPSYFTWYIVVSFEIQPKIEWVHVGEVRFLDTSEDPDPIFCNITRNPTPGPKSIVMHTSLSTTLMESTSLAGSLSLSSTSTTSLSSTSTTSTRLVRSFSLSSTPTTMESAKVSSALLISTPTPTESTEYSTRLVGSVSLSSTQTIMESTKQYTKSTTPSSTLTSTESTKHSSTPTYHSTTPSSSPATTESTSDSTTQAIGSSTLLSSTPTPMELSSHFATPSSTPTHIESTSDSTTKAIGSSTSPSSTPTPIGSTSDSTTKAIGSSTSPSSTPTPIGSTSDTTTKAIGSSTSPSSTPTPIGSTSDTTTKAIGSSTSPSSTPTPIGSTSDTTTKAIGSSTSTSSTPTPIGSTSDSTTKTIGSSTSPSSTPTPIGSTSDTTTKAIMGSSTSPSITPTPTELSTTSSSTPTPTEITDHSTMPGSSASLSSTPTLMESSSHSTIMSSTPTTMESTNYSTTVGSSASSPTSTLTPTEITDHSTMPGSSASLSSIPTPMESSNHSTPTSSTPTTMESMDHPNMLGSSASPSSTPTPTDVGSASLQRVPNATDTVKLSIKLVSSTSPSSTPITMESAKLSTTLIGSGSPSSTMTSTVLTKHSTPLVSSSHIIIRIVTAENSAPSEDNRAPFLLIAFVVGIGGLALLVLTLVIMIGLCFRRRHNRSGKWNVQHELITTEEENIYVSDPLSKNKQATSNIDNGIELAATNPSFFAVLDPTIPASVTGDVPDTVSTPMNGGIYDMDRMISQSSTDMGIGMYEVITPLVTTTAASANESPACMPVQGEEQHETSTNIEAGNEVGFDQLIDSEKSPARTCVQGEDQIYTIPVTSTNIEVENEAGSGQLIDSDESTAQMSVEGGYQLITIPETSTTINIESGTGSDQPIYSDVQKKKAPTVPPKSSDLEQYLATCPAFNEGIYSESINLSDFYCGDIQKSVTEHKDDGDSQIFAPVYPVPSSLSEGFQQPVEITSDNIKEKKEKKELGTGQFGQVILAATNRLSLKDMQLSETDDNQGTSIYVIVKRLKPNPSQVQQEAFDKEAKLMSQLRHPNVLGYLGVCYHDPAFIMMEYMEEGDLSQFLQRYSEIVPFTMPSNSAQITTSTLVYMASQIASAMKYLASFNYIHRDLATRNCLVGTNFAVKVADLGLNTNLYQSHYYQIRGKKLLPIRWMATECFNGIFSEKSDVWAFGITMWELFTLAKDKPYPSLSDEEVIRNAMKRVHRQFPSRSEACPHPVYEIMQQCWIINFQKRPTFKEINVMLQTAT